MKRLDCRGKVCPEPVLVARNFLEKNPGCTAILVQADNRAAAENIKRFLESRNYTVLVEGDGRDFHVTGSMESRHSPTSKTRARSASTTESVREDKILVMLANDRIGTGDPVLGALLMKNFVNTLNEMGEGLWRIVCVNGGVRLCLKGSPALEALTTLEARGVSVLVCGTCLEHYGLMENKAVGVTTNMLDIVTSLELADKVINL